MVTGLGVLAPGAAVVFCGEVGELAPVLPEAFELPGVASAAFALPASMMALTKARIDTEL